MKTDPLTGLSALTRAEVENLNPPGEPVTTVDWDQWPELSGYVVRPSELRPFTNLSTGEGMWTDEQPTKRCVTVRTSHGPILIWEGHDDLAALFDAGCGAPFIVESLPGEGFKVVVGQPDDTPEPAPAPSSHEVLMAAQRDVLELQAKMREDENLAEKAMIAAAEKSLAGETTQ